MKQLLYDVDQATIFMTSIWPKVKKSLNAGNQLTIEIKKADKSREQEEKYHAMIGDIAKQAKHLGSKWDAESWKRLLVDQFMREINQESGRVIPNLDGTGIVQLGHQTRKFSKEQASEFVEFLYCWASNNGVDLT